MSLPSVSLPDAAADGVETLGQGLLRRLSPLLARYGITLNLWPANVDIPGSHWGEREAGLIGDRLHVRPDTPLHSALHEAAHFICMDDARRGSLDTDAGGDEAEEAAVCYLQILLAEGLESGRGKRLMADMDAWGYSFRLGSTDRWFAEDAEDSLCWLRRNGIVDDAGHLTYARRT